MLPPMRRLASIALGLLIASPAAAAEEDPVSGASSPPEAPGEWVPPTQPPARPADAPAAAADADLDTEGDPDSEEWGVGGPYTLDVGLLLGTGRRLDDPPLFEAVQRQGLMLGGGVDLFLSRRVSFGLHFEHLDLGEEESGLLREALVFVDRDLNTLWGNLRLYPLRGEVAGLFVRIGMGAAWQSGELSGEVWPRNDPSMSQSIRCEGADALGFAVRGDAGVDVALGGGVRFQASVGADGHRLTDAALDGCLPGAGTTTVLSIRSALVYGWSLE